jgi:hypothetical protein
MDRLLKPRFPKEAGFCISDEGMQSFNPRAAIHKSIWKGIHMNRSVIIVLAVMFLAGCVGPGWWIQESPKIDNPAECGKVVVVRISSFLGSALDYTVALDGRELFRIYSGEYTEFLVQPGDHEIAVNCFEYWSKTLRIDSKKFVGSAAAVNYFKISPVMPFGTRAVIIPVAADEANALLRSSKFIDPSKPEFSD